MSKEEKILNEIIEKVNSYETSMSDWLSEASSYSDLYTIKRNKQVKKNRYSNPRLPEMHRAVEALATTVYRMLTANDPFFTLYSIEPEGINQDLVFKNQKFIEHQLKYSQYKKNLLKALRSCCVFGNVFIEENFEIIQVDPFGRKIPITTFLPRSITQIGFDLSSIDISKSAFIYTNDIVTKNSIINSYNNEIDKNKKFWNNKSLDEIKSNNTSDTDNFLKRRLINNNYYIDEKNAVELISYFGKLETLNDNIEYIVLIGNRKHLLKIIPNPDQSGNRKFRYAKWIDWDIEPLGYGLGRLLKHQHTSLDANRQRVTDLLAFGSYNIWLLSTLANINSNDLILTPNKIIATEDMNGLKPLETNMQAAMPGLKLEEILKSDFRAASGATDTLQAAVTEATASEVAIVQNEAMRRISVYAEILAETLVREHIEKIHNNNRLYIREPYNIPFKVEVDNTITSYKQTIFPSDLNIDVDVEVKIVTDKDFRPKKTEQLLRVIELLTSIRTQGIDKYRIDVVPIYKELIRMLDMNPNSMIRSMEEAEVLFNAANLNNPNSAIQKTAELQNLISEQGNIIPERPVGNISTPIGNVVGSNVEVPEETTI